jgi:hypothetical protein
LKAARVGEGRAERSALASLTRDDLAAALPDDSSRLAFWINVYNGYIQLLLRRDPRAYRRRGRFFAKRQLVVARKKLSFNDIEHGILRRSMFGYSVGYVANPFPGKFERRFRLDERDPRIHFALNCGAASCPPIAAYLPERIDEQLDLATRAYLESEVEVDASENVVRVPRILSWFRGDFGGKPGILRMLRKCDLIAADSTPRIRFNGYDWTMDLGPES